MPVLPVLLVLISAVILGATLLVRTNDTVHDAARTAADTVEYPLSHRDEIQGTATRHQVNPYWVCAVIKAESDWRVGATSSAGAIGLMQVLPATAQEMADWGFVDASRYPVADLAEPAVNIEYGTAYLRYLVERYHEMEPAIAAYNAGMANVDAWLENGSDIRAVIEFPETRSYLLAVVWNREKYETLYPDAFTTV